MPASPGSFLPLKPIVLEILLALADGPAHGYAILQLVRTHSDGRVSLETGPLYRHLNRLLDDGLVVETEEPESVEDGDARRRYYRLSESGREVLRLEGERLAGVLTRTRDLGLLGG